ncbi:25962_t:CDS:2 [Racocetra persica]|uniref:25962_t:CDS:1 n=1 Tax=Racocetra persica TaxID=160502 RepID=A0ACA9KT91_9GLOM|nr:25962_t:CDS:2 [Racocetra persica]
MNLKNNNNPYEGVTGYKAFKDYDFEFLLIIVKDLFRFSHNRTNDANVKY